jgi:protein subunit release factor B
MNYTRVRQLQNEFASELNLTDEELLDHCEIQTFRSSGKGGQHVNKTESAVRLVHITSGITVTCSRERSQYLNKMECLVKLREKLEKKGRKAVPRLKTKVPLAAKKKRRASKEKKSSKKEMRRTKEFEE